MLQCDFYGIASDAKLCVASVDLNGSVYLPHHMSFEVKNIVWEAYTKGVSKNVNGFFSDP